MVLPKFDLLQMQVFEWFIMNFTYYQELLWPTPRPILTLNT